MVIRHNLEAFNSSRHLNITTGKISKSTEKLSSGYKINRAADDAAGLAISEKMRRQIKGLTQASRNAVDGISMVQTAEGGLNEVHDMLHRMNLLSVQSSNATLSSDDRDYLNEEFQALKKEINRVANTTTFNEVQLFPPDGSAMYSSSYDINISSDGTTSVKMKTDAYTVGEVNASPNAKATSEYLAKLIPDTIKDLLNAYPSLKGAEDLSIKLDMAYIDGGNNTLAYAAYSYYTPSYDPVKSSFLVKVDTSDFTDSNALVGGERNDLLKATLAHELTHTIMQYNLTKSMATDFPDWFIEGTAQVSGGGFSTGWLSELASITDGLTSGDSSKDGDIQNYLKKYNTDTRPYGHGYLATAYAGYIAGGRDLNNITAGIDKILGYVKAGDSFEDAMKKATGKTVAEIKSAINGGSADAAAFARELSIATGRGAGSSVYGLANGSQILGGLPADGSSIADIKAANTINLHVGAEKDQMLSVSLFSIGTKSLGLDTSNISTIDASEESIGSVKNALCIVSTIRSYYGATQNRLEHTIKNLDNVVENTTAAESAIRDTDMSKEMVEYSNSNIIQQAGVSILANANQNKQSVLQLLG